MISNAFEPTNDGLVRYNIDTIMKMGANIQGRADWLPDPCVLEFVENFVRDNLPDDAHYLLYTNHYWAPITIVATLDWIKVGGWWLFSYTSVGLSEEQYQNVWAMVEDGRVLEQDPNNLLIFLLDANRNFFEHRWQRPGLSDQEYCDLVPFIEKVGFPQWDKDPPPREIVEIITWATLLWVLSENGFDWARDVDILFDYTAKFDRTFLEANTGESEDAMRLLDPRDMVATERPIGTCAACGTSQYCVDGYLVLGDTVILSSQNPNMTGGPQWVYMCNTCAVDTNNGGSPVYDERIDNPLCGNSQCLNTSCPHLRVSTDQFGNRIAQTLIDAGRERVDHYQKYFEATGSTPRQLQGQTLETLLNNFGR